MQVYSYVMTIIRNSSYAEEITQNTFFKAMTAKKQFKGNSSELTWLCGIAKHLAIDECRKNKKLSELDEAGAASIVDIEKAIEDKDTALQIHLILHELQEPYKEVFQLRVFGELSFFRNRRYFSKNRKLGKGYLSQGKIKDSGKDGRK